MKYKLIPVGIIVLFCLTSGEFPSGNNFHIRNFENNLCLTSNANDFRAEVGVFLGQVTLEQCDLKSSTQKWSIIVWSTKNGAQNKYWFYPKENGLNELTAVLDDNGVYPVNNFFEVTELDLNGGRSNVQRFILKSLEFKQCLASQGKSHPISYENCDLRRKDQQWKVELYQEDSPKRNIFMDFGRFVLTKYFGLFQPDDE